MKIIWMCWLQGEEQAPLLVKSCISSWRRSNPDWEVRIITHENLNDYVGDIISEHHKLMIGQHYAALSDLLRISLIYKYGGVWADATTYCFKPLNDWIFDAAPNGFFCFDNSHKDKTASSWFIYAEKFNPLVASWLFASLQYWDAFKIPPVIYHKKKYPEIYTLLEEQGISWFDQYSCQKLSIFPYFWFHLLLDELILRKEYLRNIYLSKSVINSGRLTRSHMMRQEVVDRDIKDIRDGNLLMFKLTHKFNKKDLGKHTYGSIFEADNRALLLSHDYKE